jgi:hypothetical protein
VVVETRPATNPQRPVQQAVKALPPAGSAGKTPRSPGRPALASVPFPRAPWMTDDLINRAVAGKREGGSKYGRTQIMAELGLKNWQGRDLLRYIDEHGLTRRTA